MMQRMMRMRNIQSLVSKRSLSLPTNEAMRPFYALGLNVGAQAGQQLKGLLSNEELDVMLEGFQDFMKNRSENEHVIMTQYGSVLNTILQARLDADVAAMEQQRDSFIEQYLKTYRQARQTESGLVYHEVTTGTGPSPTTSSTVRVHYHGKFLDGKIFDSSLDRGEPVSFPLENVIQGWQEGLQLMKVGGKSQLVVPSHLGYGTQGSPPVIPPSTTLIFDVELLAIE